MTDRQETSPPTSTDAWAKPLETAQSHLQEGRLDEAVLPLRQASELARGADAPESEGLLLGLLGQVLVELGRGEEAVIVLDRALTLADEEHHPKLRTILAQAEAAIETAPWIQQLQEANQALTVNEAERALAIYDKVIGDLSTSHKHTHLRAQTYAMQAQALYHLEHIEAAQEAIQSATRDAAQSEDEELSAQIDTLSRVIFGNAAPWAPLLEVARQAMNDQQPEAAMTALKQAIQHCQKAEAPGPEASAQGLLAVALINLGQAEEARPHLLRALAIAKELGDPNALRQFSDLLQRLPPKS